MLLPDEVAKPMIGEWICEVKFGGASYFLESRKTLLHLLLRCAEILLSKSREDVRKYLS